MRKSYTVAKKLEVVKWHKRGGNLKQTSRHFKIDRKRIREWLSKEALLLQNNYGKNKLKTNLTSEGRTLGRKPLSQELDNELLKVLQVEREKGASNKFLAHKARKIAARLGLTNFKGSCRFINRWKKRYHLTIRKYGTGALGTTRKGTTKCEKLPIRHLRNRKHGRNTKKNLGSDKFCWSCHKEGTLIWCTSCPRSFHPECDSQGLTPDSQWSCLECNRQIKDAGNIGTQSPGMALFSPEQLKPLLEYALGKLKETAMIDFHIPVSNEPYPVVYPMDLSLLEKNVEDRMYGSTKAFLSDVQWIRHNCISFNGDGHMLAATAEWMFKIAKQEMEEIEICPDCYLHVHTVKQKWFIEPCRWSHVLVWAKTKASPYLPGKALRVNEGNVEVWVFGVHKRVKVPLHMVFLLSYDMPRPLKPEDNEKVNIALGELEQHLQKLQAKLRGFVYAPLRTPLDVDHLYLQPISKSAERRYSETEVFSQPELETATKATNHVEPSSITDSQITVSEKKSVSSRCKSGLKRLPSSPSKKSSVKYELKIRSRRERVIRPTGVFEIYDEPFIRLRPLDTSNTSVNLDVTELPDSEGPQNVEDTLDQLQEQALDTRHNDGQDEEGNLFEVEPKTETDKLSSSVISNSSNDTQAVSLHNESLQQEEQKTVSCVITRNAKKLIDSEKSYSSSQRLDQTIESCKEKVCNQDIDKETNMEKSSETDDETIEECDSLDCGNKMESDHRESDIESQVDLFSISEAKCLQSVISDTTVDENMIVPDNANVLLSESLDRNQESVSVMAVENEDVGSSDSSVVVYDSTNSGRGTFAKNAEIPTTRNYSELRTILERENGDMRHVGSTESDMANYAHKVMDYMKDIGHDRHPQDTIRSLELELEKQKWQHRQELVEMKHETDMLLLKVRSDLRIEKEKALSELEKKHYIDKSKTVERLKRKSIEERRKFEEERKEIKKKQWCANCEGQAIYSCCWNTSYCNHTCQQAHWPGHRASCRQAGRNSMQTISSQLQARYLPNQTTSYRMLVPNMSMVPPTLQEFYSSTQT